jgi:TonB family protein
MSLPGAFSFLLVVFWAGTALAQDPAPAATTAPAAQSAPTDPKALMLQAAKLNGLTGDDVKPWHLKATYELLGDDGKPTDRGTFEEFWVSPTKYKLTFTGNTLSVTEYGSEKGEMRTGAKQLISSLLVSAQHDFVEPLPTEITIQSKEFSDKEIDSGGMKLSCISATPGTYHLLTYCLNREQPILRISTRPAAGAIQILHNRILRFQGHFIAGDLKILRSGKSALTAHVESIEPLAQVNEADFTPPADAVLMPHMVNISGSVVEGMLLRGPKPDYPATARELRISGTVVLQGCIGKDGKVFDLKVVSGHQMLRQAALDAVRQWEYRPYLLNDEPVDVMTTINLVFDLSGKAHDSIAP